MGQKNHFICMLRLCKWLFKNKMFGVRLKNWDNVRNDWVLDAFCDSDWENCKDSRKSVSGWVIFLCGNDVGWGSRSQRLVTLASAHAEYTAITEVSKEVLYLRNLMNFLNVKPKLPIIIHCDNSAAIFLSNNQESRLSKHLDTKVHSLGIMLKMEY